VTRSRRFVNWTAVVVWSASLVITTGFWTACWAIARLLTP
jgi:hypothetical protein